MFMEGSLRKHIVDTDKEAKERLEKLNSIAKKQYNILQNSNSIKKIEMLDDNNTKLLNNA